MLCNTYRVYAKTVGELSTEIIFDDSAEISSWAKESVAYMTEFAVMTGVSETEFSPTGTYTREQCYVTFLRLYKNAPCSILNGGVNDLITYDKSVSEIMMYETFVLDYSCETEDFGIFYGWQTTARVRGYMLWIVYKDGSKIDIAEDFDYQYYLTLTDFSLNEDETILYCTDTRADMYNDVEKINYAIDIDSGKIIEKIFVEYENND